MTILFQILGECPISAMKSAAAASFKTWQVSVRRAKTRPPPAAATHWRVAGRHIDSLATAQWDAGTCRSHFTDFYVTFLYARQ